MNIIEAAINFENITSPTLQEQAGMGAFIRMISSDEYLLCLPVRPSIHYTVGTTLPLEVAARNDWLEYVRCLETHNTNIEIDFTKARNVTSQFQTGCIIPEGVTSIGKAAFEDCESLTSVVIPEGVTEIGERAFRDCTNLTSVMIPEGVTKIGYSAFEDCTSLTSVVIPESVTEIGEEAFEDCKSLTSIVIPEGVTEIRNYAFYGCSSLSSVVIPKGVTEIGKEAFVYCRSITSVTIPKNCKFGEDSFPKTTKVIIC